MNIPLNAPFSCATFPTKGGAEPDAPEMIEGYVRISFKRPENVTKNDVYEAICFAVDFDDVLKQIADAVKPLGVEISLKIEVR
jgi:hypothetical protein